ncbi:DNA topoisomerase 2-binding protein 1 [Frankliniella fusca]|uniref:DNA topoisomerase 2-binding protein 1 n=1 Tax=Frankliniella fusca TaxID=407009 RepID=A0AAE1LT72_9NEOP|nr:DNA topoisomerase 2-binding protein 1 [Frankliniella fusca]
MCAHKYMGMPLRSCSTTEPPDEPGTPCLYQDMMSFLESQIKDMWCRLHCILEVFRNESKPDLGYRLRVKENLPIRVTMRPADHIVIGWKAIYPDSCPSSHLYLRSDINEHCQYLGGPVSYCNWSKVSNIIVRQVSHGSAKHLVLGECKLLPAGCEIVWDYGQKKIPAFCNEDWFQPEALSFSIFFYCCCVMTTLPKNVHNSKSELEVYRELCALCGKPYKAARRDWTKRKCQKKVHFLNSHADFFGTDWDGCGFYDSSK